MGNKLTSSSNVWEKSSQVSPPKSDMPESYQVQPKNYFIHTQSPMLQQQCVGMIPTLYIWVWLQPFLCWPCKDICCCWSSVSESFRHCASEFLHNNFFFCQRRHNANATQFFSSSKAPYCYCSSVSEWFRHPVYLNNATQFFFSVDCVDLENRQWRVWRIGRV